MSALNSWQSVRDYYASATLRMFYYIFASQSQLNFIQSLFNLALSLQDWPASACRVQPCHHMKKNCNKFQEGCKVAKTQVDRSIGRTIKINFSFFALTSVFHLFSVVVIVHKCLFVYPNFLSVPRTITFILSSFLWPLSFSLSLFRFIVYIFSVITFTHSLNQSAYLYQPLWLGVQRAARCVNVTSWWINTANYYYQTYTHTKNNY